VKLKEHAEVNVVIEADAGETIPKGDEKRWIPSVVPRQPQNSVHDGLSVQF
jgi:hypothetical protein